MNDKNGKRLKKSLSYRKKVKEEKSTSRIDEKLPNP